VHETFSEKKLLQLKMEHPDAEVIAHPECEEAVLKQADYIGSTTALLNYSVKSPKKKFIVVTEAGILHQMEKAAPEKTFIPSPPNANCACNECPYMRRNTLEKIALCLETMQPEIELPENLRVKALVPIQRMLDLSV
jgi:quinolinate synthase